MLKFISRTFALVAIVLLAIVISPTISNSTPSTQAVETPAALGTQTQNPDVIVIDVVAAKDDRVDRLAKYFAAKASPFTPYAPNFIEVADRYDLDWTLLPAIANLESQLGKMIPAGSFNPYGWNNGNFKFGSWENANETVANGLRTRYAPSGEITPFRIGKMYAASHTWAVRVAKYQADIRAF